MSRSKGVYKNWVCLNCFHEEHLFHETFDGEKNIPITPPLHCEIAMTDAVKLKALKPNIYVVSDLKPFWTVAADKFTGMPEYITSRRQHEEFLRRNDYVEIGDQDLTKLPPPTPEKTDYYQEWQKFSQQYDELRNHPDVKLALGES